MTAPPERIFAYVAHDGRLLGISNAKANPNIDWPAYVREDLLSDPNAVHLNMLRGTIAKPSLAQIAHIYGDEWTAAIDAAEARGREQGLREAAAVAEKHELDCAKWVLAGRGNPVASEACAEIYARILMLIPAPKETSDE